MVQYNTSFQLPTNTVALSNLRLFLKAAIYIDKHTDTVSVSMYIAVYIDKHTGTVSAVHSGFDLPLCVAVSHLAGSRAECMSGIPTSSSPTGSSALPSFPL